MAFSKETFPMRWGGDRQNIELCSCSYFETKFRLLLTLNTTAHSNYRNNEAQSKQEFSVMLFEVTLKKISVTLGKFEFLNSWKFKWLFEAAFPL